MVLGERDGKFCENKRSVLVNDIVSEVRLDYYEKEISIAIYEI